jgi:hypothetical protein
MARERACRFGRHRWTWSPAEGTRDIGDQDLRCFDCSTVRPAGKRIGCWIGLHRWVRLVNTEGERYRKCLFCRRYESIPGASPVLQPGGTDAGGFPGGGGVGDGGG